MGVDSQTALRTAMKFRDINKATGYKAKAKARAFKAKAEILHADPCRTWPCYRLGQISLRGRPFEKISLFLKLKSKPKAELRLEGPKMEAAGR